MVIRLDSFLQEVKVASSTAEDRSKYTSLRVPHHPLSVALLNALVQGGTQVWQLRQGWHLNVEQRPIFHHLAADGSTISISIDAEPATARATVAALSQLTTDVALVLLHLLSAAVDSKRQEEQYVQYGDIVELLLAYKQMARPGPVRQVWEPRLATEVERLLTLRFAVVPPAGHSATAPPQPFFQTVADSNTEAVAAAFGAGMIARAGLAFGEAAAYGFTPDRRPVLLQIPAFLLQLDHRDNRRPNVFAKKVGLYVLLACGQVVATTTMLKIADLLTAIGEMPHVKQRSKNWAGRTRDRLDEALLQLVEHQVIRRVDWPAGFGPDDANRNKGWVEHWLTVEVQIQLAAVVYPQSSAFPTDPLTLGRELARLRRARGLSQQVVAGWLGISASYLSKIEQGQRMLPSALIPLVQAFLDANDFD